MRNDQGSLRHCELSQSVGAWCLAQTETTQRRGGSASACTKACRQLEDPYWECLCSASTCGKSNASRNQPVRCPVQTSGDRSTGPPSAPRAITAAAASASEGPREGTMDGAQRRTSSRRSHFDRGLALNARSETLADEFASMTAVPTISGCCGGRHHPPQDLRGEAREPETHQLIRAGENGGWSRCVACH